MAKISTKTIQYSVYDRTKSTAKYIEDTTTYTRPELAMMSDSVSGSGLMGELDMPSLAQLDSMEFELALNKTNAAAIELFAPGVHKIEVRWVTNVIDSATGASKIQANKDIVKFVPKTLGLGDIETNETNEGTIAGEVLAFEHIIDGKSVINIDKLNQVFKINGKDYASEIKKAL